MKSTHMVRFLVIFAIFTSKTVAYPFMDGVDRSCHVPYHPTNVMYAQTLNPCDVSLYREHQRLNNAHAPISTAVAKAYRADLPKKALGFTPTDQCRTWKVDEGMTRSCWVYDEKGGLHVSTGGWSTEITVCKAETPDRYNATFTLECNDLAPPTQEQADCVADVLNGTLGPRERCF